MTDMKSDLQLHWTGPLTFYEYLHNAVNREPIWKERWPPASEAVYLVSQHSWSEEPTIQCGPLYVGGNTGKSDRFCTRIGDLIADMFGFYDGGTGHHSGGQSLWKWCDEHREHPGYLYLAWARSDCALCAEGMLFERFPNVEADGKGLLNKNHPPVCTKHA